MKNLMAMILILFFVTACLSPGRWPALQPTQSEDDRLDPLATDKSANSEDWLPRDFINDEFPRIIGWVSPDLVRQPMNKTPYYETILRDNTPENKNSLLTYVPLILINKKPVYYDGMPPHAEFKNLDSTKLSLTPNIFKDGENKLDLIFDVYKSKLSLDGSRQIEKIKRIHFRLTVDLEKTKFPISVQDDEKNLVIDFSLEKKESTYTHKF